MFDSLKTDFVSKFSRNGYRDSSDLVCLSDLQRTIGEIATEASYLGIPILVKLCRTILEVSTATQDGTQASDNSSKRYATGVGEAEKRDSIAFAIQTLCGALTSPDALDRGAIEESIERLRSSFTLKSVATIPMGEKAPGYIGGENAGSRTLSPQHTDSNVYDRQKLDPLNACYVEESWTVSQLATLAEDIATGLSADRCGHRLMQLFRSHKHFHRVDRTCLALRVATTNQLVVVDSCVSPRVRMNGLRRGYSCFVNPKGSLFSLKPGMVRVFGESNRVIESFRSQRMPVQRSIALLADSGLNSGICMALGRGSQTKGFLFFNSADSGLFDDAAERFTPLFSLFGLVGTLALDSIECESSLGNATWFLENSVPHHAVRFSSQEFSQMMTKLFSVIGISEMPRMSLPDRGPFLYLPRLVSMVFYEYMLQTSIMRPVNSSSMITVSNQENETVFELSFGQHFANESVAGCLQSLRGSLGRRMRSWPVCITLDENRIQLRVPLEPVFADETSNEYSIVH